MSKNAIETDEQTEEPPNRPSSNTEQMEDQDYLFSNLVKYTNDAILITDLNGSIEYCNKGFTKITGYEIDEIKGKKPGSFLQGPETSLETTKRIRAGLDAKRRVSEKIVNYHRDGSNYWLQLDIYPIYGRQGNHSHFMAVQSVITDYQDIELLASQRKERLDQNIAYAKKLQNALFRQDERDRNLFDNYFILDMPKDEVGGDFYVFDEIQNKKIVFLGDCTGHGASGAILTALCTSTVKSYLQKYKTLSPAMIIEKSQQKVSELLESNMEERVRDNMEATLLFIDETRKEIKYATTTQELYYISDEKEVKLKPKRAKVSDHFEIRDQTITYQEGAMIYISSDGFKDQFGAESGKKYGSKRLLKSLSQLSDSDFENQQMKLEEKLKKWKGDEEHQTDDILMIGIQLQ